MKYRIHIKGRGAYWSYGKNRLDALLKVLNKLELRYIDTAFHITEVTKCVS